MALYKAKELMRFFFNSQVVLQHCILMSKVLPSQIRLGNTVLAESEFGARSRLTSAARK